MRLSEIAESLVVESDVYRGLPEHVAAFCGYLIPDDHGWPEDRAALVGGNQGYQAVAAVGYALARRGSDDDRVGGFEVAMEQLSGRVFFAESRTPRFEVDGIALLGVALGARTARIAKATCTWLGSLLERSARALKGDGRDSDLVEIARGIIDPNYDATVGDPRLRIAFSPTPTSGERQAAWSEMIAHVGDGDPVEIAINRAVWEHCVRLLAVTRLGDAGVAGLVESLEGLAQSMSHWTYEKAPRVKGVSPQQWEVKHEYHVQNLLWTVLRPLWGDLVDEQSLPKVGHKTPRYDLGIPSLETIVEVKFMRSRGSAACRRVTDEIAADRSLYLVPNSGYKKLVVFIWDECRQTEEYQTLKVGLEGMDGIEKVVILSRPSRMDG